MGARQKWCADLSSAPNEIFSPIRIPLGEWQPTLRKINKLHSHREYLKHVTARAQGELTEELDHRKRMSSSGCLQDFLTQVGIPGMAYMRAGAHWSHRVFWWAWLALALVLSGLMADNQRQRWRQAPVIVTRESVPRRVTELPVPAATFCLPIANRERKLFDYDDALQRWRGRAPPLAANESEIFQDLSLLHPQQNIGPFIISENAFAHIEKFSIPYYACTDPTGWRCADEASTFLVDTGTCTTLNALPGHVTFRENTFHRSRNYFEVVNGTSNWSPDAGYSETNGKDYPEKVRGFGPMYAQYVMVDIAVFPENVTSRYVEVRLHSPADVPGPNDVRLTVEGDVKFDFVLEPFVVRTDPGIREWYTPEQRQCYFADEKYLRFFRQYTQKNCELECLSNVTLELCGCVPFYFPRDVSSSVCHETYSNCLRRSQDLVINETIRAQCDCLASCSQLEYVAQIANSTSQVDLEGVSEVNIYFGRRSYVAYTRTELYGTIDFIASVGGLLSLFLGMTLLTVVELGFWFLKLCCGCCGKLASSEKKTASVDKLFTISEKMHASRIQPSSAWWVDNWRPLAPPAPSAPAPPRRWGFAEPDPSPAHEPGRACALRRSWRLRTAACVAGFLEGASIPGLAYMKFGVHWMQRCFWACALALALTLWALLAAPQWTRWRSAPVIITMETAPRSVTDLPFPAATACTFSANVDASWDFMHARRRFLGELPPPLAEDESRLLQNLVQLCPNYDLSVSLETLNITRNIVDMAEEFAVRNFSYEYTDDNFPVRKYGMLPLREGMCHIFNSLPGHSLYPPKTFHSIRNYVDLGEVASSWTPDTGFDIPVSGDVYPKRPIGSGPHFDFEIRINFTLLGRWCYERKSFVEVTLKQPAEASAPTDAAFVVEPREALRVGLTPHLVSTDPALGSWYSPRQRQCYFQDERPLRFFAFYSQSNCEYECLSNLTLARCGCVPYYFPHGPETKECLITASNCYFKMFDIINNATITAQCDCLSSCNEIEYRTEITKTVEYGNDMASVKLFFPRRYFLAYKRTEVFGIVDLIANVGGLLGLFVGMSLLSAAEILFWLLRLLLSPASRLRAHN